MDALKIKLKITTHNGNTNWTCYVITNAKNVSNPRPLMNGTSGGRPVAWGSFDAPDEKNTPEEAIAIGLEKAAQFIRNTSKLPPQDNYEVGISLPLAHPICSECGRGMIGGTIPEVYSS